MFRGVIAVALLLALTRAAPAEEPLRAPCDKLSTVEAVLASQYREFKVGVGLVTSGKAAVTRFQSRGGKTWTIVVVYTNGCAVIIAAGNGWEHIPWKPYAKEDPS